MTVAVQLTATVDIGAPFDTTWQVANDLDMWSSLFPDYYEVQMLDPPTSGTGHGPDMVDVRFLVRTRTTGFELRRLIMPAARTVLFERLNPPGFRRFDERWEFHELGPDQVRLRWLRTIEPTEGIDRAQLATQERHDIRQRSQQLRGFIETAARVLAELSDDAGNGRRRCTGNQ